MARATCRACPAGPERAPHVRARVVRPRRHRVAKAFWTTKFGRCGNGTSIVAIARSGCSLRRSHANRCRAIYARPCECSHSPERSRLTRGCYWTQSRSQSPALGLRPTNDPFHAQRPIRAGVDGSRNRGAARARGCALSTMFADLTAPSTLTRRARSKPPSTRPGGPGGRRRSAVLDGRVASLGSTGGHRPRSRNRLPGGADGTRSDDLRFNRFPRIVACWARGAMAEVATHTEPMATSTRTATDWPDPVTYEGTFSEDV